MCSAIPIVKKIIGQSSCAEMPADDSAVNDSNGVQKSLGCCSGSGGSEGRDGEEKEGESIEYELIAYMDKFAR